jgi:hypothetical protein
MSNGFRAGLEQSRKQRQAKAAAPPAPAPAEKAKAEKPTPPQPQVTHVCGHTQPLANVTSSVCPQCRAKARQKRAARSAERQDHRDRHADERLPDGAHFDVTYDATNTTWSGTLIVRLRGQAEAQTFEGTACGVFALLRQLDRQYRAALEAQDWSQGPEATRRQAQ